MKKTIRIAFILCCLLLQSQLFANTVIVKGYVKDSANHVVANKTVKIYSTDSTNNGCLLSHTVLTNANGYYIDTLTCNGTIRSLAIIVEGCNGLKIIHDHSITSSNIVESNFIICTILPTTQVVCKAAFTYTSSSAGIKFNGSSSTTVAGDTIISRTWTFGDSTTALTGNSVDPLHAYSKPGTYNACLIIKTKKGCESSYCRTVVYTTASYDCQVQPMISIEKLAQKKYRFNSSQSTASGVDSIVQRIWKFSDGSSLDGNQINPTKEFKDTGLYTICIHVRTARGCEKEFCVNLLIHDSIPGIVPIPTYCKAIFTYSIKDSTIQFNSAGSTTTSPEDSIISRTWYYMDNATTVSLSGNVVNPSYKYSKPGTYQVYLVIKTKKGCESKFSATVIINRPPIPTNCKAQFTFTLQGKSVKFNSNNTSTVTGDSIVSRYWLFGDKTELNGNQVDPTHQYLQTGNYTACLYIKTKSGCESKICMDLTIRDSVPQPVLTNCKAIFTYSIKDSTIQFNSAGSTANSPEDSIISRTWYYMDNVTTVSLTGNVVNPSYTYSKPGTYNVYLVIKTKKGCESKFSSPVIINRPPVPTNCKAQFTFTIQNKIVKFTSATSTAAGLQDSIISRSWLFGDSSNNVQATSIEPSHNYSKSGKYTVTLYIKTKSGCESKFSAYVVIETVNCPVEVVFNSERITLKKIQFNSSLSKAQSGDSIIQRNWKFGDNTILSGNEVKPIKEFPLLGVYTTCLQVRTLNGCEAQVCKQTVVQDTLTPAPGAVDFIKILSINPNPVITRMITTIFSRNANVEAEISIYDIYGTRKLVLKKLLVAGNNIIEINTEFLQHGPYFLKVSSKVGTDTKAFYKL